MRCYRGDLASEHLIKPFALLLPRVSKMSLDVALGAVPGPAVQVATAEFVSESRPAPPPPHQARLCSQAAGCLEYLRASVGADRVDAPHAAQVATANTGHRASVAFGMFPAPLSPWYAVADGPEPGSSSALQRRQRSIWVGPAKSF